MIMLARREATTVKRAAIYARYSSDLQTDRSIEDQISLCSDFAAKQGLTIVAEFDDRARSGASIMGRDGVLSMMDAARDGKFDVLVVEALDRLSRDQEDLAGIYKRLTHIGVEIRAVHDGKADIVQVGIRGLVGALYLQDLAHKVRRGMAGVVRDGRNAGGKAYGYAPVPGKPGELVIVEEEAEVVRRIFADYAAGKSPREIAGDLNAENIAPPPRCVLAGIDHQWEPQARQWHAAEPDL
jgi:site-specific DNA recombinase